MCFASFFWQNRMFAWETITIELVLELQKRVLHSKFLISSDHTLAAVRISPEYMHISELTLLPVICQKSGEQD